MITGLGGGVAAHVNWKESKQPVLVGSEKLVRVIVVRSHPLADSALTRALEYRGRVVDLLQKRIEVLFSLVLSYSVRLRDFLCTLHLVHTPSCAPSIQSEASTC